MSSLLDLKDCTQKSLSLLETKQWWETQLLQLPTQKDMTLTRYMSSLHHELQVYQQNKESLQEELLSKTTPKELQGITLYSEYIPHHTVLCVCNCSVVLLKSISLYSII